ncbi:hypothetical protein JW905_04185 [bacterium]|nr:hypothetical protein [candidate division CSSED10-310 bacterium]
MSNIRLRAVPLTRESLRDAASSLVCTFDPQWEHLLEQGEEIELTKDRWMRTELSSEFTRGVSLQQVLVLDQDTVVFTLSGYAYPTEAQFEKVARVIEAIAGHLGAIGSERAVFLTMFPSEDRRHYRLRGGRIAPFDILERDGINYKVQAYINDSHNSLLIGTRQGLFRKDVPGSALIPVLRIDNVIWLTSDQNRMIYMGTEQYGVFVSENGGTSWRKMRNLPVFKVLSMGIDNTNKIIYINTLNGIFESHDDGRTWFSSVEEFMATDVRELVFTSRSRILIVKTKDNRLYFKEV